MAAPRPSAERLGRGVAAGRVAGYLRLLAVAARSPAAWLSVPIVVGMDLVIALGHGAPWRGEIAFLVEWQAPVILLIAPVLAGAGAWLAREDNGLDRAGTLRGCVDARRHTAVRVGTAAGLAAAAHLLTLAVLAAVSLATAQVGGPAVGPLMVQLVAFPAFTALGYLVGRLVDHVIGPVLATSIALLAAYADYGSDRWPLGLMSDGGIGPYVGQSPDRLAVAGRLGFCVAVTGLATLAASGRFAATRTRWLRASALVAVGAGSVIAVQTHPQVWVVSAQQPAMDRCAGQRPQVCGIAAYAGLLSRAAGIADRAAVLLRSTGATGLRDRYVGWTPTTRGPADTVFVVRPGTAYQAPAPLVVLRDVVAPKSCRQWLSGTDLDREGAAEQIVLTWLVAQDPGLAHGSSVPAAGADLAAFSRQSADQQRAQVAAMATALATCRFAELPRPGSG